MKRLLLLCWIGLALLLGGARVHADWRALGLSGRIVQHVRSAGGFLYACTDDGLRRLAIGSPDTLWSMIGFSGEQVLDFVALDPQTFLASRALLPSPEDSISLYRSIDGGVTWGPFQNGYGAGLSQAQHEVQIFAGEPSVALFAGDNGPVEKSTDQGTSWRRVPAGTVPIEVAPGNHNVVWVGGESNGLFEPVAFKSTDAGETWQRFENLYGFDNVVSAIAFHPSDANVVYLGMWGEVDKTTDGGASWSTTTSPDPNINYAGLAIPPRLPLEIFAAGTCGCGTPDPRGLVLYRSTDEGASWEALSYPAYVRFGATHLLVRASAGAETVYVATANGVYRYTDTVAGISERPDRFAVSVMPNPARGAVRIAFALPFSERVAACVYAASGARVRTLIEGERLAGGQAVLWDGRDDAGRPVPSGLYFFQLALGSAREVRRIVLLN